MWVAFQGRLYGCLENAKYTPHQRVACSSQFVQLLLRRSEILGHAGGPVMRVLLLVLLLCSPAPSSLMANAILFTDRTAFNLAVGDTTLLTFDTFVPLTQIPGTCCDFQATYHDIFRIAGDITGASVAYAVPGSIG